MPPLALWEESFGSGQRYLDIYYEMNPRGPFLAGGPVKFRGYLVTDDDQEEIRGVRTGEGLSFETSRGKFSAKLARAAGDCKPRLRYAVERSGRQVEDGILKGAFCH